MATNKVVYNGKTLIDLTGDTVTASNMASGVKAHNKSGTVITGTLEHRTDLFQSGSVGTNPIYNKSGTSATISISQNVNNLGVNANTNKAIVQEDDILTTTTRANNFGDAPQDAVVSGYTFTSANGVNISGTLPRNPKVAHTVSSVETHVSTIGSYNFKFAKITGTWKPNNDDKIGAYVGDQDLTLLVDAGEFGNASVKEVKKGVTFTSINGVKLTGTLDVSSSGTSTGTATSDATATAANILSGKTAYISSGKTTGTMKNNGAVTGTISTKAGTYTIPSGYHSGSGKVSISSTEQNKIIASNIKSGVSILGVTGTYTGNSSGSTSSNNNCEAYLVDVTNPTVSFKTTSGTIKAYGYATATSSSSWGGSTTTMYAFNGTNYYKSVSYGTPSATSITLGVSNGKLTGLPDLASGTLLVTRGI